MGRDDEVLTERSDSQCYTLPLLFSPGRVLACLMGAMNEMNGNVGVQEPI